MTALRVNLYFIATRPGHCQNTPRYIQETQIIVSSVMAINVAVVDAELGRMGKEAVIAYFQVPAQNFLGGNV